MISYIGTSQMPSSLFGNKQVSYADYIRKTSQQPPRRSKSPRPSPRTSRMDFEEEPQAFVDKERISISVVQNGHDHGRNGAEHHGKFRRAIPCLPMGLAGLCCFCNVFIPGLGTLISSFAVLCCADPRGETKMSSFGTNLLAAFLQFLTFPIIVGVVWSIIWGVLFIQLSHEKTIERRIASRKAKNQIAIVASRTEQAKAENV